MTGPDEEAANPAGKSETGSSTDSRSVPVSCPEAAASGVIDAVGSGPVVDVGAVAAEVADADWDSGVAYGVPLVAHPVTVASMPTATARTVRRRRCRRATSSMANDGTGLPNLMRTRTLTTYLPEFTPGHGPRADPSVTPSQPGAGAAARVRNNDAGTPAFADSGVGHSERKRNVMPQRIAIVTGAARGIGAGTAKRLAADGLAVAVLDLNEADGANTVAEIEKAGGKAIAVGADVSNAEQVQAAVDKVVAELGEPTVLVNNAGVTRDNLIFKMSENDWDTVMTCTCGARS